jgi:hypothetical protein
MGNFEYTVTTNKPFTDVVEAVEKKTVELGFRVLHTHDIAATLAEKGFPREPVKIVEICNAKYASQVLEKDATPLPPPEKLGGRTQFRSIPLAKTHLTSGIVFPRIKPSEHDNEPRKTRSVY